MKRDADTLLLTVDLVGTFVFASEGAMTAIEGHLDFLGMMVLAFATALGGGMVRDVLIGAVPPNAIRDWRYTAVALAAAPVVFVLHHFVQQVPAPVIVVLDAAGLGLFAVAGAGKALAYGIHPFIAILLGTITGVGGGTMRDILLARIPAVLHVDIYATAALIGSAVMIVGLKLGKPRTLMAVSGGVVCFLLRVVSVWQQWQLPKVTSP
jgi:uncharacterized membrane protein YeiH